MFTLNGPCPIFHNRCSIYHEEQLKSIKIYLIHSLWCVTSKVVRPRPVRLIQLEKPGTGHVASPSMLH